VNEKKKKNKTKKEGRMRFVATLICMILVGLSHAKHANDEKDFLLKEIVKLEKKRLPGVGGDVFRVSY
jgi:hypothetical protein